MITLTIQISSSGEALDIMVKPEQRIEDVIGILIINGRLLGPVNLQEMLIFSWRLGTYVNQRVTFKQGSIMTGDILYIGGVNENEKNN